MVTLENLRKTIKNYYPSSATHAVTRETLAPHMFEDPQTVTEIIMERLREELPVEVLYL